MKALNKKSVVKWSIGVGLALVLLFLSGIILIHYKLQSPEFTKKIVHMAQTELESQGIYLEIDQVSINILGGCLFQGIRLKKVKFLPKELSPRFEINKIQIKYSLTKLLFQKRFTIKEIELSQADINIDFLMPETSSKKEISTDKKISFNKLIINSLSRLNDIPVTANINKIDFSNINLKLNIQRNDQKINILFNNINLKSQISFEKNKVNFNVRFQTGNNHLGLSEIRENGINLEFDFTSAASGHINLYKDKNKWPLEISFKDITNNVTHFTLTHTDQKEKKNQVSIDQLDVNFSPVLKGFFSAKKSPFTLEMPSSTNVKQILYKLQDSKVSGSLNLRNKMSSKTEFYIEKLEDMKHVIFDLASETKIESLATSLNDKKNKIDVDIKELTTTLKSKLADGKINSDIKIESLETSLNDKKNKMHMHIKELTTRLKSKLIDGKINNDIKTEIFIDKLSPHLKAPLKISSQNELRSDLQLNEGHITSHLSLNDLNFWKISLDIKNNEKKLESLIKTNFFFDEKHYAIHPKMSELKEIGSIETESIMNLNLNHPFEDIKKFDLKQKDQITVDGDIKNTTVFKNPLIKKQFTIDPIKTQLDFNWNNNVLKSQIHTIVKNLKIKDKAGIQGLKTVLNLEHRKSNNKEKIKVNFNVHNKSIKINKKLLPSSEYPIDDFLQNFKAKGEVYLTNFKNFTLKKFKAEIGNKLLFLTNRTDLNLKDLNVNSNGNIVLDLNKLKSVPGFKGSGKVKLPWKLTKSKKDYFDISGEFDFLKVFLSYNHKKKKIEINNMRGRVPFTEEFILLNKTVKLSHLIHENPFERVDFTRIRPLLNTGPQLRIKEIKYQNKKIASLYARSSLYQNLLRIHELEMEFLEGELSGKFFFNFHPKYFQMGLLSNITNLNPQILIPNKSKKAFHSERISARTGITYDLLKNMIIGRIDVTKIGKEQLISLIDILDPEYKDDQLNNARFGLGMAAPTRTTLIFKQGLMDLFIEISTALGISKDIDLKGIPLNSFMKAYLGQQIKNLKKVPLK